MNCVRRCLLVIVLIGFTGAVVFAGLLSFASRWLPDSDAVAPADAIVVLAGDSRRMLYAADLYRQGLAPQVLVSRPIRGVRERILVLLELTKIAFYVVGGRYLAPSE